MSENKVAVAPELFKSDEELEKAKKAIASAKSASESAKDKLASAQEALKNVKPGDVKATEEAKKVVDEAEAEYTKKRKAETQVRIKAAQVGDYNPEVKERGVYHVKLDKPNYDKKTGKKLSKDYVQKFTVAEWNQFIHNCAGLGFDIQILWNPEVFKS